MGQRLQGNPYSGVAGSLFAALVMAIGCAHGGSGRDGFMNITMGHTVGGTVLDEAGKPVAGCRVTLEVRRRSGGDTEASPLRATTDDGGHFTFRFFMSTLGTLAHPNPDAFSVVYELAFEKEGFAGHAVRAEVPPTSSHSVVLHHSAASVAPPAEQ